MKDLWHKLDCLPSGKALLVVWQRSFGAAFAAVQPFLQPTTEQTGTYPCPSDPHCGCDHDVREDLENGLVAVCTCGDGDCAPVRLEVRETIIFELDRRGLGAVVARTLGFEASEARVALSGPRAVAIGLYAPLQAQAYLYFPASEGGLLCELESLARERSGPFLLLTPTRNCLTAAVEAALDRLGCATLVLAEVLDAAPGGHFLLKQTIEPVLANWTKRLAAPRQERAGLQNIHRELSALRRTLNERQPPPEPISEEVASQAFALVKALDAEDLLRKPPTILTVFRLFCIEELSATQIAAKFNCAKLSIIRRLNLIRDRTGARPTELRRLSPHFTRMEEQMSDPRASHIHRKRMIYDEEEV
jgi:hypothetical protein